MEATMPFILFLWLGVCPGYLIRACGVLRLVVRVETDAMACMHACQAFSNSTNPKIVDRSALTIPAHLDKVKAPTLVLTAELSEQT